MSIMIIDKTPTNLTATRDGESPLELFVEKDGVLQQLSEFENVLLLARVELATIELCVPNFVHQNTTYEVHAWPELPGGGFSTPWTRGSNLVTSGAQSNLEVVVLFVAIPSGMTVTTPDPLEGPPGPDQAVIRVKIAPKGSMPIP